MAALEALENVYNGEYIPWIDRFIKLAGKALDTYKMAPGTDHVIAGISGGKDSLALLFALRMLQKQHSKKYRLTAVCIDWEEFPAEEADLEKTQQFCSVLEVDFQVKKASVFRLTGEENFSCYFCAREKKLQMFRIAEKMGACTVAFGHHMDDHIETCLMNLLLRGKLDPMLPKSPFFKDKFHVIRPLCLVSESVIRNLSDTLEFPVFAINCPYKETNIRADFKPLVSSLLKMDRNVKKHIFDAYSAFYNN